MTSATVEIKKYHAVSMRDIKGVGRLYHSQDAETVDQAMERAALFATWFDFTPVTFEIRETFGE